MPELRNRAIKKYVYFLENLTAISSMQNIFGMFGNITKTTSPI
jgi:hypothetical protein